VGTEGAQLVHDGLGFDEVRLQSATPNADKDTL